MLGAELGTCADTLLATSDADRQSLKTGLFHLSFNIISITIGLLVFPWFVQMIEKISGNAQLEQKWRMRTCYSTWSESCFLFRLFLG
jgi:phosphate:Na+ symporter